MVSKMSVCTAMPDAYSLCTAATATGGGCGGTPPHEWNAAFIQVGAMPALGFKPGTFCIEGKHSIFYMNYIPSVSLYYH